MKNLKIWMKMAIGLGAIILLLAVLSVLTSSLLRGVNKEALALQDEYLPIQDIATQLNANVLRVPALMNDYLLTGKKETYEHLEDVFKTIRQKFADMADLQARFPHLNAGFVAKAKTAYDALEQTVHASHDTHEKFMAQRTHMINTGAKLVQEVAAFVTAEGAMQQEALRAQDTAELNRILPLIREANLILDGVNAIRASMMRSLAEQNRSYAKDNVPVRFPALLKRVDDLNTMVFNPRIQEILKSLRASVVNFRDVQISMQQLWDEQEKLTAARVPAREATLTLMQQVVDRADEMQNTAMSHMTGAVNNSINVTLAICMITLLITMAVGFGLTRSITVPVAQALRFAQAVAGGRLDQRLGQHSGGRAAAGHGPAALPQRLEQGSVPGQDLDGQPVDRAGHHQGHQQGAHHRKAHRTPAVEGQDIAGQQKGRGHQPEAVPDQPLHQPTEEIDEEGLDVKIAQGREKGQQQAGHRPDLPAEGLVSGLGRLLFPAAGCTAPGSGAGTGGGGPPSAG